MTTEDALRQRILRLVKQGVDQKVLAAKMGVSESWLSRWLNKRGTRSITVAAMDGFQKYVQELSTALEEPQPPAETPTGTTGAPFRQPGRQTE